MSRIGKQPVDIASGVDVKVNGSVIEVKGPKGKLTFDFHPDMSVKVEDSQIIVERATDQRHHRALHGLTRALIGNMMTGVSEGFTKVLEINGTGYRGEMEGDNLRLELGFSHPVVVEPPADVSFEITERGKLLTITAIDKQVLGQVAADIRKLRPPEPYKGKGIRYQGEYVRQKAGKAGKVGA